jgi:hypothetical protein
MLSASVSLPCTNTNQGFPHPRGHSPMVRCDAQSQTQPVPARILPAPLLAAAALTLCLACSARDGANRPVARPDIEASPAPETRSGALFDGASRHLGVNLDWTNDTVEAYAQRIGRHPDVLVDFFAFPLGFDDERRLDGLLQQAHHNGAIALVTLEPINGLGAVNEETADHLARLIAPSAESGVSVLVRFAHEMNGSWYVWSQQPQAYREAFVRVARSVRSVPGAAMLWAPNYGGGYPFAGGRYQARPGTAEFTGLDTNGDGRLDRTDDPYAPYYPGDEWVDWVGMSLYHWGAAYPWGENESPEPHKFAAQLTGTYLGAGGDETATPDFYEQYAVGHNKPLAIPETAALYQPGLKGAGEAAIKGPWMAQVLSVDVAARFPRLRMINWFEWRKSEAEVGGAVIDWRGSSDASLATHFATASADWRH